MKGDTKTGGWSRIIAITAAATAFAFAAQLTPKKEKEKLAAGKQLFGWGIETQKQIRIQLAKSALNGNFVANKKAELKLSKISRSRLIKKRGKGNWCDENGLGQFNVQMTTM